MRTVHHTLIIVAAFLLMGGCRGFSSTGGPGKNISPPLRTTSSDPAGLRKVNRMLVAPIFIERTVDRKANRSLSTEYPFFSELLSASQSNTQIEVVSGDEVLAQDVGKLLSGRSSEHSVELSRKLSADAVLITRLHRFEEREGSRVAADRPASLSFQMQLLSSQDGRELWNASYHFRDEALSENLFRIGERASLKTGERGWRNAHDVLLKGFKEALSSLGKARAQEFSTSRPLGG